jgi:hypothetical protein
MAACIYSSYDSDNLQIDYYAEYGRDDNLDKDSIEILSLHILGEKVSFHLLPKNLQTAILSLYNDSI